MKTTVEIPNVHYFMQYAALQFPGSIDNAGTKSPLHLLQQEGTEDHVPISLSDAYMDDAFCANCELYDNVTDAVKAALGLDKLSDENMAMRNAIRKEIGEKPFVPYDDETMYSVESYIEDYHLEDEITACRPIKSWDTMAVAFSKRELKAVKEDLDNHIFGPTRIFSAAGTSFNRTSGDYLPVMDSILRIGTELLCNDATDRHLSISAFNILSAEEITRQCSEYPNKEFIAATYYVQDQHKSTNMVVSLSGSVRKSLGGKPYLIANAKVAVDGKTVDYPFAGDSTLDVLRGKKSSFEGDLLSAPLRMYFYTEYADALNE